MFAGGPSALAKARHQLSRLDQILLGNDLLDRAATLDPALPLRSPDAIRFVAAQLVGDDLRAVVSYDRRMAAAAESLGFPLEMPV